MDSKYKTEYCEILLYFRRFEIEVSLKLKDPLIYHQILFFSDKPSTKQAHWYKVERTQPQKGLYGSGKKQKKTHSP